MLRSNDVAFAIRAMQSGLAEILLGKLAASKSSNAELKAFGQQMVDDHTRATDQLTALARERVIRLPVTITAKNAALYQKLNTLSGLAFDRTYAKSMIKDHEEALKDLKKEIKKGSDPKIQQFASNAEPVIEAHLSNIKNIESKLPRGKP